MYLQDLFPDLLAENARFECKARLDKENILGWLKTIDGFANAKGGTLLLGVEDKTHKLIGFDLAELDKEKIFLHNSLKEHFDALLQTQSEEIPYKANGKKRFLLKIEVGESAMKPVVLRYQGMPLIYVRRDGFTSAATTEEIITLSTASKVLRYDAQVTDAVFDENDFTELYRVYQENVGAPLTKKVLASIGFFDERGFLKQGSLLFKDGCDLPVARVVCSLYAGSTRGDDAIVASNSHQGNLLGCLDYMYEFVVSRMNHGFVKKERSRVDVDAYPKRSLTEALINALAHRDYFIEGSEIHVDMFKNRLVITSPGSLFKSEESKTTYQLDKLISSRRNELISSVFVLCKMMEAKGTGFEKILKDYEGADERHKPFISTKFNQFSITLPDLTSPDGVCLEEDAVRVEGGFISSSRYDVSILAFCLSSPRSAKEIAQHLGIANSTFLRKSILGGLTKQKLLLPQDQGKETIYKSNPEFVVTI